MIRITLNMQLIGSFLSQTYKISVTAYTNHTLRK